MEFEEMSGRRDKKKTGQIHKKVESRSPGSMFRRLEALLLMRVLRNWFASVLCVAEAWRFCCWELGLTWYSSTMAIVNVW
jgi:hypothetical protein